MPTKQEFLESGEFYSSDVDEQKLFEEILDYRLLLPTNTEISVVIKDRKILLSTGIETMSTVSPLENVQNIISMSHSSFLPKIRLIC